MKAFKTKELREKSIEDLEKMIAVEQAELFKARRDLVFRKITDTTGISSRRHNIARIHTVIGEMTRGSK